MTRERRLQSEECGTCIRWSSTKDSRGVFWSRVDPIGKRLKVGPRERASWLTIVGVVGDVRQIGLDTSAPLSTYEPLASNPHTRFDLAVRASGDTAGVMAAVSGTLRHLEPGLLIDKAQTMEARIDESVAPTRLNLLLFAVFAALSLLLAAVGLYGCSAWNRMIRRPFSRSRLCSPGSRFWHAGSRPHAPRGLRRWRLCGWNEG